MKPPELDPMAPASPNVQLYVYAARNNPRTLPRPYFPDGSYTNKEAGRLSTIIEKANFYTRERWTDKCLQAVAELSNLLSDEGLGPVQVMFGNLWQNNKPLWVSPMEQLRNCRNQGDLYQSGIDGTYHCWLLLRNGTLIDPTLYFNLSDRRQEAKFRPMMIAHIEDTFLGPDRWPLMYEPAQIHTAESIVNFAAFTGSATQDSCGARRLGVRN